MCGIFGVITKDSKEELIKNEEFEKRFNMIAHRGPDKSNIININKNDVQFKLGFHRLAIVGMNSKNDQPFNDGSTIVLCNGEIYNHKDLIKKYNLKCNSDSDCEVILHLYNMFGIDKTMKLLDGEFALAIIDLKNNKTFLARDPFGVRPLFSNLDIRKIIGEEFSEQSSFHYNRMHDFCGTLVFSSEGKPDKRLVQVLPACYYTITQNSYFITNYFVYPKPNPFLFKRNESVQNNIRKKIVSLLTSAIEKRLYADRNLGFFLSGGLDSSLVLSIAMKLFNENGTDKYKIKYPIDVFSIGLQDSTDVKNAIKVVNFLKQKYGDHTIKHHVKYYTIEEGLKAISETIYYLESYDQTTVRASTPMYLLSKYIRENTNVKVLLSGEGSDELFGGYLYFLYAPSASDFDSECRKLLSRLYLYDNLRADRTVASQGMELRVPFLDIKLTEFVLGLHYLLRVPPTDNKIEKWIVRDAFNTDYLPKDILWAQKQAFSDGVGYSWKDAIKELAESNPYQCEYLTNPPKTPEEKMYRRIFEYYYPDRGHVIPEMWLPNQKWINTNGESSATTLKVHNNNIISKL
jgi:asparagine synthase (glutamine-hydrolysing)